MPQSGHKLTSISDQNCAYDPPPLPPFLPQVYNQTNTAMIAQMNAALLTSTNADNSLIQASIAVSCHKILRRGAGCGDET